MSKGFSIIVAALNEEKNVAAAIHDITRAFERLNVDYEILLFDDNSTDATPALADALAAADLHIRVFHNVRRLNIGGIYKAGIREARYEYTVLLPGDNEVDVDQVASGAALVDHADLVVTYTANQHVRTPLRRALSSAYVRIVNLLFGTEFSYTNGSNICRTDLLRGIAIRTDGFSYQTETLVKLVTQGIDFAEFGIRIRERAHGRSTALAPGNWIKVVKAIALLWWDVRIAGRPRSARRGRKIAVPLQHIPSLS